MEPEEKCFFCGVTCPPKETKVLPPQLKSLSTVSDPPDMKRNLMSMFLTKEVLDAPESICESLLKTKGDPQNWFDCCQACSFLANRGMLILSQVQGLRMSFQEIKQRLRKKLEMYKQISEDSKDRDCLQQLASLVASNSSGEF